MAQALTIERAALPESYTTARKALARCERIDECKRWADKAQALASYAKQSKDEHLELMARRIRLRAIERGGVLLAKVKAKPGKRTDLGGSLPQGRADMAKAAGLSPDQAKTMLRVANVAEAKRDALIESDKPPTVEALAALGKKKTVVQTSPYRNEWCDWVFGVRRLVTVPACGFEVLVEHRLTNRDELINETEAAQRNLEIWLKALGG